MNLADKISRVTQEHDPAIEREENGDIIFYWPIKDCRRAHRQQLEIASAIGIEYDMVRVDRFRGRLALYVPAEIAAQEPS